MRFKSLLWLGLFFMFIHRTERERDRQRREREREKRKGRGTWRNGVCIYYMYALEYIQISSYIHIYKIRVSFVSVYVCMYIYICTQYTYNSINVTLYV